MRSRRDISCVGQTILGAIDLAIDFATLGEYGLETLPVQTGGPADGPCRERPGHARRKPSRGPVEAPYATGWEAFAKARRGECVTVQRSSNGRVRRLHELG